jgi:hypothetical protein
MISHTLYCPRGCPNGLIQSSRLEKGRLTVRAATTGEDVGPEAPWQRQDREFANQTGFPVETVALK